MANEDSTYLQRPVTTKKKSGEDNFQQLLRYLLLDLKDFGSLLEYVIWYTAIVLNLYMHNSSHCPMNGYGKVQAREQKHLLQYFRSQTDHPHRIVHDKLVKKKSDGRSCSYLPRNSAFERVVENTEVSTALKNDFDKLDARGFKKKNKALRKYFGTFLAHSGARINNHSVYYSALENLTALDDDEVSANEGIDYLVDKLSSSEFLSKTISKKIKQLDQKILNAKINFLKKQFKDLIKDKSITGNTPKLYSELFKYRIQLADTINSNSKKLDLEHLIISTTEDSTCVYIDLYPEFTDKIRESNNYKEGFTNVIIGFFGGLLNHHAHRRGLFIQTDRRQSFGFYQPTLTDIGTMRIRLSLGLEPEIYAEIVADSLRDLDKILDEYDFTSAKNKKVKDCFVAEHKPKGKTVTEKTGNRLLAAMSSDQAKWLAFSQAQHYLNQADDANKKNYVSKAFSEYLENFIIGRAQLETKPTELTVKMLPIKARHTVDNFNATPLFAVLNNLVNYAVDFVNTLTGHIDDNAAEILFKQCYWHSLTKLYNNCTKAINLLTHINDYEVSHMYAKANLLIENISEYLNSLETLKQIIAKDQKVKTDPVATLTTTEQKYISDCLGLDNDQVDIFYADSGQQAITASLLAMDMELVETEIQADYCDHSVYVHDESYFELITFLKEVDSLKCNRSKLAKIAFFDLTAIHEFEIKSFPKLKALIIDITHCPDVNSKKLKELVNAMHAKDIWVLLVSSGLKHDELGTDKYQTGKIITLAPEGETLSDNIKEELQSISDEAMPCSVAAYLQMANQVYRNKVEAVKTPKSPKELAVPTQAPILKRFGIFTDKETQIKPLEPAQKHKSHAKSASPA
jgi:hypothetical protein